MPFNVAKFMTPLPTETIPKEADLPRKEQRRRVSHQDGAGLIIIIIIIIIIITTLFHEGKTHYS